MNAKSNIPGILKKILETKKAETALLKKQRSVLKSAAEESVAPLNFKQAITASKNTIIAEVKKASPSAGIISKSFHPELIAQEYQLGGADAVSVLTDKEYFKGSIEYLKTVKKNISIPVLRKDFIISEEQIYETRSIGADSFLLIASILEGSQLSDFISLGRQFGMEPLVEVHNEKELEKAINANSQIIGINNRNLHDFSVDINIAFRLIPLIPNNRIIVGESGINSINAAEKLYKAGCNSLLIGEFVMRSKSKSELIKKITSIP